jgi:hypothetical protein
LLCAPAYLATCDALRMRHADASSGQPGRLYTPPVIGGAAQRQQEAEEAAAGIVFGREEGDEVQADPIARDAAALERMEAVADGQQVCPTCCTTQLWAHQQGLA